MKYIDFNDKAITCISAKQWQEIGSMEYFRSKDAKTEQDRTNAELTVVNLGFTDGITLDENGKKVIDKQKTNCTCGIVMLDKQKQQWFFSIQDNRGMLFTSQPACFETCEDAIDSAKLCKDATTAIEMFEILAKKFPKLQSQIKNQINLLNSLNTEPTL